MRMRWMTAAGLMVWAMAAVAGDSVDVRALASMKPEAARDMLASQCASDTGPVHVDHSSTWTMGCEDLGLSVVFFRGRVAYIHVGFRHMVTPVEALEAMGLPVPEAQDFPEDNCFTGGRFTGLERVLLDMGPHGSIFVTDATVIPDGALYDEWMEIQRLKSRQ